MHVTEVTVVIKVRRSCEKEPNPPPESLQQAQWKWAGKNAAALLPYLISALRHLS
jgi:hypothetical protein